jgi:adenosine deaminase
MTLSGSPLIDLHRHLDGSVRVQTMIDLANQHNLELPAWTVEELRPIVQVTSPQPGILAFFEKFKWQTLGMVDDAAIRRIAYENVEDAALAGLDYVELRFSPLFMAQAHQLDPVMVTRAVVEGVQDGRWDFAISVGLIGILSRTYGAEAAMRELDAILACRDAVIGLDLAGDEIHFPGELFTSHFTRARDAGLRITIHAGEVVGPESVWQALRDLGAERIGHAVHAPEDPALMDTLAEKGIPIESNLTSNVQTSTVPDYASHPLKQFLEKGIHATINTDDPGISAIDLDHELTVAAPLAGLTSNDIQQARWNSLDAAFLSTGEKERIRKKYKTEA